jgi:hypothetical protein
MSFTKVKNRKCGVDTQIITGMPDYTVQLLKMGSLIFLVIHSNNSLFVDIIFIVTA